MSNGGMQSNTLKSTFRCSRKRKFAPKPLKKKPFHAVIGPNIPNHLHHNHNEVTIIQSHKVERAEIQPFVGNSLDKVLNGNKLAYSIQGTESFGSRVLDVLSHSKLKDIIFDHLCYCDDDCEVVLLDENGKRSSTYFFPDFADMAMLPLPLKLTLKYMLTHSKEIPKEVKELWETCSPSLPNIRPSCNIYGPSFERWACYSNVSKVQMFSVFMPSERYMMMRIECQNVSSNVLDGRRYVCHFHVSDNGGNVEYDYNLDPPKTLFWNCQGVGRPSFLEHFTTLKTTHDPDIIVLLETRCAPKFVKERLEAFSIYKYTTLETHEMFGGVTVLSMKKEVTYHTMDNGPNIMWGFIHGLHLRFQQPL